MQLLIIFLIITQAFSLTYLNKISVSSSPIACENKVIPTSIPVPTPAPIPIPTPTPDPTPTPTPISGTNNYVPPDGPWIGDSWSDAVIGLSVQDGVFSANSPNLKRYFNSAKAAQGVPTVDLANVSNNPSNVQRIMRLFKQSDWNYLFPVANKVYTYETFLQAAAKFPAFCNEKSSTLSDDLDNVCKKEMISMWAHWAQETGGHSPDINGINQDERQALYYLRELGCENGGCEYTSTCSGWINEAYPCKVGQRYYGRGAKQVSYNFNYGPFSKLMYGDVKVLLENPDRIAQEGWLAVASGFWFYMTPQSPKPSIHDVVTGFWQPNAIDLKNNFKRGFGTTINIINGGVECGAKIMPQAQNRVRYYNFFASYMKVVTSTDEVMDCSAQPGAFPDGGTGTVKSYWDADWNNPNRCQLVSWQTAFSIFFEDSYVRCVQKNALGLKVTA